MFNWDNGIVIREWPALAGVGLFLCGYLFLQLEKFKGHGFSYSFLNAAAACLLLLVTVQNLRDNVMIVGMLVVYLAISIFGIVRQAILTREVDFNANERIIRDSIAPRLQSVLARKFLDIGEWTRIEKGSAMTTCGQMNTHFFVLKYGTAEVTVDDKYVATIHPVSLIGEMSIFTGEVALATVTATENCVVYAFEYEALKDFLVKNSTIRAEFERQISKQISSNLNRANRLLTK